MTRRTRNLFKAHVKTLENTALFSRSKVKRRDAVMQLAAMVLAQEYAKG